MVTGEGGRIGLRVERPNLRVGWEVGLRVES